MVEPKRNSDIASLEPAFRQKFDVRRKAVKAIRPDAQVFEAKRTLERQVWLHGIGRTHHLERKPITWTMYSNHLKGKAVDVVFTDDEATPQIENRPMRKGPYDQLIELGKKYGVHNLKPLETCHFEDDLSITNIIKMYEAMYKELAKKSKDTIMDDVEGAITKIGVGGKIDLNELLYFMCIGFERLNQKLENKA